MRIAIIGLGLIGGSIGLSLNQSGWQQAEIVGYARRQEVGSLALELGAVHKIESSLQKTVNHANIVVIATPVLTIKDIFAEIADYLDTDSIVTDTASTKFQVMRWAETLLPKKTNFIGGHPMAGKEVSGISMARADLFQNCAYCLTPALQIRRTATEIVEEMVRRLGAVPLTIDAQQHDNLVAGISHLPLLLSVALVLATTKNPSWQQMSQLAASGYRDTTRLASGNPEVNAHICVTNQDAIVSWISLFCHELQSLGKLVANGNYNKIEKALSLACKARQEWLESRG